MNVEVAVTIKGSKGGIWDVVTDIERASETINGIEKIEILDKPEDGLVGLKWRETRTFLGKTATEDMWITEAVEEAFYTTRAESHGSVYVSTIAISEHGAGNALSMTLECQPQSFLAKLLSFPMGVVFKSATRKALLQDLNDIKAEVERRENAI